MSKGYSGSDQERGFSLIELLISITITLVVVGLASTLLSRSFNIRQRENQRTDALADAQRALNIMARELANAGFNLMNNGIVAGDSGTDANGNQTIRFRANLNKFDSSASQASQQGVVDAGEDVKYYINTASNTRYLVRQDVNGNPVNTVLANEVDALHVHYYNNRVTYDTADCDITGASSAEVAPNVARYLVIAVCIELPQVGTPGAAGYQPALRQLLVTDVALRNANLSKY